MLGGAEHATLAVAGELHRRGTAVSALLPRGGPVAGEATALGLAVACAPLGGAWNLRALPAVGRALREEAPGVALVTTSDEWVWACLAPRPRGTRLVLVRHMALPLPRRVSRLASRRADRIVAVSRAAAEALAAGGVDRERISVIPNPSRLPPLDEPPGPLEREAARRALGLPAGGRLVGFFGGLREEKGIFEVVEALGRVREAGPDVRLLVCGREGSRGEARALAPRFDRLGEAVHLLGETGKVREAMIACDAVVLATRESLREASPMVVLEAMASGVPVIAADTGGVAEVLGPAGRTVRPDDPAALVEGVLALLADPVEARANAAAALGRVRDHFDLPRITDRWQSLFRKNRDRSV